MKVLLAALGTHGDVLPFLAVGQALARRGHVVELCAPESFAPHARAAGLGFQAMCTQAAFERTVAEPDLWHPRRGAATLFEAAVSFSRATLAWIEARAREDACAVVASPLALGGRLAQDLHGLPLVTLHVTPFLIESRTASPWMPGIPLPGFAPSRLRHWLARGGDRFVIDPAALPALNALRAERSLRPVRRLRFWWNSPTRMLLMFPAWYAPPQADWPSQAVQVGFPLADRFGDTETIEPDLADFLDRGAPPLVFTYGSDMRQAEPFFARALRVCTTLGRRGLFIARGADQVPASLPADIRHVRYAPLSLLLPRSAALIHHGGIGTVAQALASGTPQIVVPVAFNHFDDARRRRRLDLGAALSFRAFTPARVAAELDRLAGARSTASRSIARGHMDRDDGVEAACAVIEAITPGRIARGDDQRPPMGG